MSDIACELEATFVRRTYEACLILDHHGARLLPTLTEALLHQPAAVQAQLAAWLESVRHRDRVHVPAVVLRVVNGVGVVRGGVAHLVVMDTVC